MALAEAGIAFEVVPGVTSAFAAPSAAGIPVTHRGVAAAVTVVTGHRRSGEPDVDFAALAKVGGTIVILMGVAQRAAIADALISGGLAPSTPVAAVMSATTERETCVRGSLADLYRLEIRSPATIVIGPVAAYELTPAAIEALSAG